MFVLWSSPHTTIEYRCPIKNLSWINTHIPYLIPQWTGRTDRLLKMNRLRLRSWSHHPSASPVITMWKVVGQQHVLLNITPNNFAAGTWWKIWCDWDMRNKQLKFKTLGNLAAIIEECREREREYIKLTKLNRRRWTCNRVDLGTLGSRPTKLSDAPK